MNDTWKTFLLRNGAVLDSDESPRFDVAANALPDANLLIDLSATSLIRATGADARTFLNGQFTNDIALATPTLSQLSAWCNAQGRMLAVLRVFTRQDELYLQLPRALRDDVLKRLRMFVMRSKVTLESVENLVSVGVTGPDVASALQKAVGTPLPEMNNATIQAGPVTLIRVPGIHPRYQIIAAPDDAIALWTPLSSLATPASSGAWEWHDIMAGIPSVQPQTVDAFVPQMANLELIEGVNFKKGCYPGQEIVARVQYLGRLKQRMYRAHGTGEPPFPGTPLYMIGNEQSVGTVVSAQPSPDGGADLLAVVQITAAEQGDIRIGASDGPALILKSLPYLLS